MYALIELLEQKNTSLQVKLYQERPKNLSIKYLIPRFNDNNNNNNFSFQTLKTYFSNFLNNLK